MDNEQETGVTSQVKPISKDVLKSVLDISIESNNMKAYVSISDFRAIEFNEENLEEAINLSTQLIEAAKISNVNREILKDMLEHKVPKRKYLIAEGKPASDGVNAEIKYYFVTDPTHPVYKEDETGNVNFHETFLVCNVKESELIAEVISHTEGEPGYDVFGKVLKQKPGKPAKVKAGKNVVISDDGQKVWSGKSGRPFLQSGKICVEEVFKVGGDLDYSIGNISFTGDVIISGTVPEGFKVEAGANILIQQNVDHSSIYAKGNVEVKGNITSWKDTVVKADGDVILNFMENGNVFAGHNVVVVNYALQSAIEAKNQVIIKSSNAKSLIGGHIKACRGIETIYAGNPVSNAKTFLELYIDESLLKEIVEVKQKIENEEDKEVRKGLKEHLDMLNQQVVDIKKSTIRITGKVYPGVIINMFGKTFNINSEFVRVCFYYDEFMKKIEIKDIP